jgi:hypothetical protein
MPECRRLIDLDGLPPLPARPAPPPCLHFIAAWGPGRAGFAHEVLWGLEGNRELVIRNLRPADVAAATLDVLADALLDGARRFARIVDDCALFGDPHERDAVAREWSQLILGPDPMIARVSA